MRIPTDLLPGDRLWYSETEYCEVTRCSYGAWMGKGSIHCERPNDGPYMRYYLQSGKEVYHGTTPIIRIERIASAPAKVKRAKGDKDAKWLLQRAAESDSSATAYDDDSGMHRVYKREAKRFRAIARRLEGKS